MKFTAEKSCLSSAVATAGRAVSGRNTLPILSNILVEAVDDHAVFTATDLDTAIRITIPASVTEYGAVAIPASALGDLLSKLPDAPVTIELKDAKAVVRCGKSQYTLLTLPAEDYPVVPETTAAGFAVEQGAFKNLLHRTLFAASKEETRSILMGVLIEAKGRQLVAVTTDTHRLGYSALELQQEAEEGLKSVIVPAKAMTEIERMMVQGSELVTVTFGDTGGQIGFSFDNGSNTVSMVSRVLDGQFPNYNKVIPENFDRTVIIDRKELLDAVRRVFIIARSGVEKARFDIGDGLVKISSESPDGQAYEEVPAALEGEAITMAFNCRYMLEVLGALDDEQVQLCLTGPLNPGVLRLPGDANYKHVLMPMQI